MGEPQQPHAFLSPDDFRTMLSVIEAYILYLKRIDKDSEQFQDLYTRMDIAVVQLDGGQAETLHLSHDELTMVLRAIFEVENAVHERDLRELEPYRNMMQRQVGGLRARILAGFPSINREKRARLN